jgi:hypothetical protein
VKDPQPSRVTPLPPAALELQDLINWLDFGSNSGFDFDIEYGAYEDDDIFDFDGGYYALDPLYGGGYCGGGLFDEDYDDLQEDEENELEEDYRFDEHAFGDPTELGADLDDLRGELVAKREEYDLDTNLPLSSYVLDHKPNVKIEFKEHASISAKKEEDMDFPIKREYGLRQLPVLQAAQTSPSREQRNLRRSTRIRESSNVVP